MHDVLTTPSCAKCADYGHLARLIAERDDLLTAVGPNLEAQYQVAIGQLDCERFWLDIAIRRLKAHIDLFTGYCGSSLNACAKVGPHHAGGLNHRRHPAPLPLRAGRLVAP